MRKIVFTGLLSLLTLLALGQDTPEQMIKTFFQDYQTKTPEVTLDNLYAHMPWADRVSDALENMKTQFSGLKNLVGDYIGYDLITKKDLVNRFIIYTYLVRFDRQPVRFTFKFYKPKDKWDLYGFAYDDSLGDELEEATKVFNLGTE